jgi:hypothetical protein
MVDTPSSAGLTGQVLFYQQPEPLSLEAHGGLGLKTMEAPFAFAATANVVPLHVSEFGQACGSFPIIFAGEQKTPMAVMGVRAGENLFLDAHGQVEPHAYIPAFMRRYPFVLAGDGEAEQMVVCIDRAASMVTTDGETRLFENGKLSPFSEHVLRFCTEFETERRRTEQFCARLEELKLFDVKQTTFTPRDAEGNAGEPQLVAEFYAVAEERLAQLTDAVLRELFANGALRQIHLHLNSMLNWDRLMARAAARPAPAVGHA